MYIDFQQNNDCGISNFVEGDKQLEDILIKTEIENLKIIESEQLISKASDETIPYFASKINNLKDHPLVGEVRSCLLYTSPSPRDS